MALTGAAGLPVLLVLGPGGQQRRIEVKSVAAAARRAEVLDFTAGSNGAVYALVFAVFPRGRDQRLLCRFPQHGEASCEDLGERRCRLLAVVEPETAWCFGEGPAGMLLHRISGPLRGPRFWLPAEGPFRGSGAARAAWLDSPAPGKLWLVLPEAAWLVDVRLSDGQTRLERLPVGSRLTGAASFAVLEDRLLALLPLESASGQERLDASYGLFELRGAWRNVAPHRQWMRGARLAGAGGGEAWIWNRHEQRLEALPVPPR